VNLFLKISKEEAQIKMNPQENLKFPSDWRSRSSSLVLHNRRKHQQQQPKHLWYQQPQQHQQHLPRWRHHEIGNQLFLQHRRVQRFSRSR